MKHSVVLIGMICAILLPRQFAQAQLPQRLGAWELRENEAASGKYPPRMDAVRFDAFGAKRVWGVYRRAREEMTVLLAECETRERAFGLFGAAAQGMRHGIVGDAFSMERAAQHIHYGPFYLYISASGRGARVAEDLILGLKRALFNRADCYASDIPLPIDDRVLGSELYIPPDGRAWGELLLPGLEPVMPLIRGRAAWIARYDIRDAKAQRLLVSLPMRSVEALKALEAGIIERYATEGTADEDCRLASFLWRTYIIHILPGKGRLFIAVVPARDSEGCAWAGRADDE
ncbi:MAG: hypothetical protein M5R41_16570 [Bacteroidia bacterium]|nr:hypothetical protein [Bacteroidia bacterium]